MVARATILNVFRLASIHIVEEDGSDLTPYGIAPFTSLAFESEGYACPTCNRRQWRWWGERAPITTVCERARADSVRFRCSNVRISLILSCLVSVLRHAPLDASLSCVCWPFHSMPIDRPHTHSLIHSATSALSIFVFILSRSHWHLVSR